MGFYGCDIEDQDAVLAMVRERISSTSTARINRSKDEGVAGCVFFFFLLVVALSTRNFYHMLRGYRQTFAPGSFSAFKGSCAPEEA